MVPKIPPMAYREVHRVLARHGFLPVRQTGGHVIYRRRDGRGTVVPRHGGDLEASLVRKILKEAGIDLDSVRR